jgi:aspartyl-tRNA(Asn)/glutamyl-tRNA(Gln) amidotransferase subunit A
MKGKRIAFSPRLGYVERFFPKWKRWSPRRRSSSKSWARMSSRPIPASTIPARSFRPVVGGRGLPAGRSAGRKKAQLDPGLRRMAEEGKAFSLKEYLDANAARGDLWQQDAPVHGGYDFLLTPAVATTAFDVGRLSPLDDDGKAWMAWTPFSFPFNLTQQPAASINCGFTSGWPAGGSADRGPDVRRCRRVGGVGSL